MFKATTMVLLILSLNASFSHSQELQRNIVGYYTSWSIYGRDYHVPDIPADDITHINYAFANIANGEIVLGDHYADIDRYYEGDSWEPGSLRGCFRRLQVLKEAHPHVKTFISVGGWTWSMYFSNVALTSESRSLFAASCVDFITTYGFDGVDIDWEYPVSGGLSGNITRPEDRENYTLLLAELRSQLDAAGDYLLTIAAPANPAIIANLEVESIHQYLDWLNIMSYDFHGPWGGDGDPVTNFNASLYVASDDPLEDPMHSAFNLAAAVQAYVDLGVPRAKINPGLAFYGRGFGSVVDSNNGLFVAYGGVPGAGTWEPGVFDYWDLAANYIDTNGYTAFRHDEARVPWVFNPSTGIMISYDDPTSITEKCRFIGEQNLGGAMFWEFSGDRNGVLLDAAYQELVSVPTAVPDRSGSSSSLLRGNHPDPFNATTQIDFVLTDPSRVRVAIHDARGRRLAVLEEGYLEQGEHSIIWHGRDSTGRTLASGIYICVLDVDGNKHTERMTLVK